MLCPAIAGLVNSTHGPESVNSGSAWAFDSPPAAEWLHVSQNKVAVVVG